MKRVPMTLQLETQTIDREWPTRAVQAEDANDLAILLYASFRGTIDDEGEPFSTAVSEIEKTMAGDYGRLLTDCSFVIAENGFISSACLISWYEPAKSPFVVFTMTHPESKMKGMARFLLKKSINALISHGDTQLTLIVTDGNAPAQHLYASLGFEPMAG
ncbi:GNAT family N-acetyltransferase, partial [Candidatus Bipolaricaulota bacterium]|nr:GNAT family N-acetyltransferase [Candidatus Bipolaricaulota bacterium]